MKQRFVASEKGQEGLRELFIVNNEDYYTAGCLCYRYGSAFVCSVLSKTCIVENQRIHCRHLKMSWDVVKTLG